MTHAELARHNGQNGQPAYVAIGSIIYDVSTSPLWCEGNHENVHQAGTELSHALKTAPHVAAVIERFPVVGHLEESPKKKAAPNILFIAAALSIAVVLGWALLR